MEIVSMNNLHKGLSFQAYEKTFAIIKPDAFKRELDPIILRYIKSCGLEIIDSWEGVASRKQVAHVYKQYRKKAFFPGKIDYMVSGKLRALILGGEDAVAKASRIKRKIRTKFVAPDEKRVNLIHSSDTERLAKRESKVFFKNKSFLNKILNFLGLSGNK